MSRLVADHPRPAKRPLAAHRRCERRGGADTWRFALALLGGGLAFGGLAVLAHEQPYFPLDLALASALQAVHVAWLDTALAVASWAGFPPQVDAICGLLVLALWLRGLRRAAALLVFAGGGAGALWFALAPLVNRPRPSAGLVHVATGLPAGGFPSGHVLVATAVYGFLLYLALAGRRPSLVRLAGAVACVVMLLAMGLARVAAGAHWPSDVLAGYLLGLLWLALTIRLYRSSSAPQRPTAAGRVGAVGAGTPLRGESP